MIVDEAEINFGHAASYAHMALRPSRQVVFLVTPQFNVFIQFLKKNYLTFHFLPITKVTLRPVNNQIFPGKIPGARMPIILE